MSRGHTQGFDSNAAQFARMGNPWEGEPVLKRRARKGRRLAKPAPGPVRVPERSSRDGCDVFAETQFWLNWDARQKAASGKSRTVAATADPRISPTVAKIASPNRTELTGWQRLERNVLRIRQRQAVLDREAAAERAYQASEAFKAAERRRIAAAIAALEARAASLA